MTDIRSFVSRRRLGIGATAGALGLLLLHVAFPAVSLDGVTAALLILAAVPWLGAWIKSIEVAGVKLELNELKQELGEARTNLQRLSAEVTDGFETQTRQQDAVLSRVERIESLLTFSGLGIPDERQVRITQRVRAFLAFMREHGARFGPEPGVEVVDGTQFGQSVHYDPPTNRLVVSASMVTEDDFFLRECCFRVFHDPLADAEVRRAVGALATTGRGFEVGCLIAGLGFYFVCSFKDDPHFLGQGQTLLDLDRPEVSRWIGALVLSPSSARKEQDRLACITAVGDRWAHVLWSARKHLRRGLMDEVILQTWNELNDAATFRLGHAEFRAAIVHRLAIHDADAATAMGRMAKDLLAGT